MKEHVQSGEYKQAYKYDDNKPATHLLPFRALEEVAAVMKFGAVKYEDHNWRHGMKLTRLLAAALRHIFAWARGIDNDEESGLSHLAHASFCVLAMLECYLDGSGIDDRYKQTKA